MPDDIDPDAEMARIAASWHKRGTRVTSRDGLFPLEGLVISYGIDADRLVMAEIYTGIPERPFVEVETRFLDVVPGTAREPDPVKKPFTVLVRGVCDATAEIAVMAVDEDQARIIALNRVERTGFRWDISEVGDINVEGFA